MQRLEVAFETLEMHPTHNPKCAPNVGVSDPGIIDSKNSGGLNNQVGCASDIKNLPL